VEPSILTGHRVAKGHVKGVALVSRSPISYLGGVDPETGRIVEKGHELEGITISGRVLVYPVGKGSTAGSFQLYELARRNKAPKAIINLRADPVTAIGAIISNIPMVDRLESDPFEFISTGDEVEVDADKGLVRLFPKEIDQN
jgi:predicted aconitase with swiveling domain